MNYYTQINSPVGPLLLVSDGQALTGLYMSEWRHGKAVEPDWIEDASVTPFPEAACQLEEYFEGTRQKFDLPLAPHGTSFQQAVWQALLAIPYGKAITYKDLAQQIGRPKSVRAVGQANGHNPISIIIPCHRVVGSNGTLTGYGGGLERKDFLLTHETRQLALEFKI